MQRAKARLYNFLICSMYTHDEETIIAQCTPRGSGAIALLRLSGLDAVAVVSCMARLPHAKSLLEQSSHTIHFGYVLDAAGSSIDQVLFLLMRAPSTFTGQDTVEITCHNNQFLIEQIISRAIACGARLAQEGEFTRRAYQHGKLDLLQAEAIDELIRANNQQALKKSLAQLTGSFSHWIAAVERKLVKATAWCEASFEFLDDEGDFVQEIREQLQLLLAEVLKLQQSAQLQKHVRQGVRIALIGSVNAGKSSLFNALVQHKRAIVSDAAGTTRDSIEAGVYRESGYWTFIDTAGLRETENSIEKEGIERSHAEAALADIILLVFDASRALSPEEQTVYDAISVAYPTKIISVFNKADLNISCPELNAARSLISSLTGFGLPALELKLEEKVQELLKAHDSPFLVNKRHYQLLQRLAANLEAILALCHDAPPYELISVHLKDALMGLSELTGKTVSEAALDAVFKEFCVGK